MTDNINFRRIEDDVRAYPVVLYMNGTPMFPRCCTSAMVTQFLDAYQVTYKTFNVQEEISLLDCLKAYTGRALVPQLFIKGELVGIGEELRPLFVGGKILQRLNAENITTLS